MPSIARFRIAIFALSLRSAGGRLSPDMSNTPWILCSVTRKPKVFMAMLAKSPFDVVGVSRCLCSSSHFAMSHICFAVSRLTLDLRREEAEGFHGYVSQVTFLCRRGAQILVFFEPLRDVEHLLCRQPIDA